MATFVNVFLFCTYIFDVYLKTTSSPGRSFETYVFVEPVSSRSGREPSGGRSGGGGGIGDRAWVSRLVACCHDWHRNPSLPETQCLDMPLQSTNVLFRPRDW